MKDHRPILLLEDDYVDRLTVKRAIRDINIINPLVMVENGEEGLAYLHDNNKPEPCIILLDLNMPKMGGLEFLEVVKNESAFRHIPVIVLTTSHEDEDRLRSFNFSVAGYMVKPVNYKKFVEIMRTINLYWSLSEMPSKGAY